MTDSIDRIITHRNMRYVPWYALGAIGGSITFMGISGMALIYTVFVTTLVMSCSFKSYYDYLVNSESNFVIRDIETMLKTAKVKPLDIQKKTHNKKMRVIYNITMLFKAISFLTFMVIISIFVNAVIFYNPTMIFTSLSHVIIACVIYYMVSFLLNVMSIIKYREI